MKWDITERALHSEFRAEVEKLSGQNLGDCYQCGKCSGGCPVLPDLDLSPNRLLRMVQLGLEDEALRNETVWCCAACGTCDSRCPMGVEILRIIDVLRGMARTRNVPPPATAGRVLTFYRSFLDCVQEFGRLSEVALMGSYNMNSGRLWTNMVKAPWFFLKGKVSLSPHKIRQIDRLQRAFKRVEEIESQ